MNVLEKTKEVMEYLVGTCLTLDEGCEVCNVDDYDDLDLGLLDSEIVRCEECSWWVPIEEINEKGICTDCAE